MVYLALRTYSFSFEIPVKLLSDSLNCVRVSREYYFYLYAFLRDLCGRDRFLTSYMRHYVLRYTIQEVLTFNVWQLYEQMVRTLFFLFVVEGAFKNISN